jgi:hypothetical protein
VRNSDAIRRSERLYVTRNGSWSLGSTRRSSPMTLMRVNDVGLPVEEVDEPVVWNAYTIWERISPFPISITVLGLLWYGPLKIWASWA